MTQPVSIHVYNLTKPDFKNVCWHQVLGKIRFFLKVIRNPASKSLRSIEISLYLEFTNEWNVAKKEKLLMNELLLNCNIMINNNTISRIYILTNPVLKNDTTGFYTCLQFDKAGFQKLLLPSSFRLWLVNNWSPWYTVKQVSWYLYHKTGRDPARNQKWSRADAQPVHFVLLL
jgi:hypothetical protein